MPGMDGFEVARRIRQLEQAGEWTPIIFLTARTSDETSKRPSRSVATTT
jgi:CheY-like chemotaxis protein